uniref:Uncharacterized protein n=1 Tax=Lotharella oceanica TaxID=641309 RepID=A0A7S2X6M4_9EUKA|mmetsp:Transcript_1456/g.2757  ORF Transcript_1456/g.2757 Transcript_1456/m.2757 type:complete len:125 (+) Transcript_1456:87-461(+)|eukprot:CAMPEP_0170180996 /NCGR_PEP_ID=MMETSP0040_2-20121228/23656_1 /TAXON_ID=641309 /ORGANISM="Lotharella oceanica, Strain CCMP622" /LENGTH=124 /DNA_ID=CAMNT_0010425847 /DNA_START=1 /DNA_END=375 /DNA_ORIENTATION=+
MGSQKSKGEAKVSSEENKYIAKAIERLENSGWQEIDEGDDCGATWCCYTFQDEQRVTQIVASSDESEEKRVGTWRVDSGGKLQFTFTSGFTRDSPDGEWKQQACKGTLEFDSIESFTSKHQIRE